MDKQIDVGYGVLDMRNGQELAQAWHQVHQATEKMPHLKVWYFDIIHTSNQSTTALEWVRRITQMIHDETGLDGDKINVQANLGLHNVEKQILKARNSLYKTAYERKIASVDQKVIQ